MKIRNILGLALASSITLCSCTQQDITNMDEWLGDKFNQKILWDVDSLAFRRSVWESVEVASGLQLLKSEVKMWGSVQRISYVTYSPNMFNTYLGYTGQENTVGDIAASYDNAIFAINAGQLAEGKPSDFFKLDSNLINSDMSDGADAILGLTTTPVGVDMKVSANVVGHEVYNSAMATGPLLLRNGKEVDFSNHQGDFYTKRMARTIVGVSSTGHYTFAIIDAGVAGHADGATVQEAAFIARIMGLNSAALLGCGDEATAWSAEAGVLNDPSEGIASKVGSIIYLGPGTSRIKGEGTAESPYLIENYVHMTQMRLYCTPGTAKYFQMTEDVDMSSVKNWTPVNYDTKEEFNRQIHFDGNGKTISNFAPELYVEDDMSTEAPYPSIFGVLYGSCKNLTIQSPRILAPFDKQSAAGVLGGWVGTIDKPAIVENVHIIDGEVTGGRDVALFGGNSRDASIKDCTANGKVTGGSTDAGGFFGRIGGHMSLENCHADVYLSAGANPGSNFRYGGLIGYAATIGGDDLERDVLTIKNCSTTGTIFNDQYATKTAGGLVAYIATPVANITGSYTTMKLEGGKTSASASGGSIANCGGVAGVVNVAKTCTIRDCYSSSATQFITGEKAGGIVGCKENGTLNIENCYSTYDMIGQSGVGGIFGQVKTEGVLNITNCFAWNPSIKSFRNPDRYSSGALVGSAACKCSFTNCFRYPQMQFYDQYRNLKEHSDLVDGTPENDVANHPTKPADKNNAFDAKPSSAVTLTEAAKGAGWSESIWDFSGDVPVLKK